MNEKEYEVKTVVLEDGIEYYVLAELMVKDNKYYYLVNMNNEKDICVRKSEFEENEEYLVTLDSIEELTEVLKEFKNKHQK